MKIKLSGVLLLLLLAACTGTQSSVDKNTAIVKAQENVNPYQLIIGKWKMESFQAFSSNPDPTDTQNIIWEFKENGEMIIQSVEGSKEGKRAHMNSSSYAMNKSIIKVNEQLYMYYFNSPRGMEGTETTKPFGDELVLDSNIDPSISNDGPTIYFSRVN